ncbi:MAG TPA: hypothetical protein VFY23_03020 [Candidatus Limnocylindrales bacterium]|nr:hypothetical protein [Candidatus Limnocylindrales bacterium]
MSRAALAIAAVLALVAACGADAPPPEAASAGVRPVPTLLPAARGGEATATVAPPGSAEPGASAVTSSGAPSSDAPGAGVIPADLAAVLFGDFRRSGYPLPATVEAAAAETCRAKPVPVHLEEIGSRPVVVTDMRGLGVILVVFADDHGATGCRVEVSQDGAMRASFFRLEERPSEPLDEGEITLGAIDYVQDGLLQRVIAAGRAGERAVKVRAGFPDDTYVTSTLRDGWYAMWWPGQTRPNVIVAADNRNLAMGKITPP